MDKGVLVASSKRFIVSVPISKTAVCRLNPMFPVNNAPFRLAFL